MQTTGSITVQNYTASKAGKKGEHHHNIGALVVELDGDDFHIRRITCNKSGLFYDLDERWGPDGLVEENVSVSALVLGDVHQWWMDPTVGDCITNKLIPKLNPERIVLHDVIDSYSISHHHRGKPFTQYGKFVAGKNSIEQEIKDFIHWSHNLSADEIVIVPSNHHEHIERWINEHDWKMDPVNSKFYLQTALYMLENTTLTRNGTETPDPFKFWIGMFDTRLNVLDVDESYSVNDVELGMHGHLGPNGSRGSIANLSRIGVKAIVGHYHSSAEMDGCLAVGTCTGKMEYTRGPSSWLNSMAVVYPDGKRCLIHIINGNFTSQ